MEERYFEERDIRGDLERNLRPKLQRHFRNLCNEMEKDIVAATSIVDVLQKPIESELNRVMGAVVAREILKRSEFQSKGKFHASVLIELGEEAKFQSYIPYLKNPVEFLKNKLIDSNENFCLNHAKTTVNLLLNNETRKIEDQVFAAISTPTDQLRKSGNKKLTLWIQQFVEACSTLEITKEMFAVAAIDDDVQDIGVFEGKVREHVAQFIQSLINREVDRAAIEKWNPSPQDHCSSPCLVVKVVSHSARVCVTKPFKITLAVTLQESIVHRPGLNGYRCITTGILTTIICTTDVAGGGMFQNPATSNEKHPNKDYKSVNEYYNSWSIPPDSSFVALNYWQWFIATFSKQLAEHYKVKQPEIHQLGSTFLSEKSKSNFDRTTSCK